MPEYPCCGYLEDLLLREQSASLLGTNVFHTVQTLERFRMVQNLQKSALAPTPGLGYLGLTLHIIKVRVILFLDICHALRAQVALLKTILNHSICS